MKIVLRMLIILFILLLKGYAVLMLTFRIRMDGTSNKRFDQPVNSQHFAFIEEGTLDRLYGSL